MPACLLSLRIGLKIPYRTFTSSSVVRAAAAPGIVPISRGKAVQTTKLDMTQYPKDLIRNVSIIAHIDHGKSTLADRLLEMTGTISADSDNRQVMDKLVIERQRGITVRASTVSMLYRSKKDGKEYLINVLDTPGHVDFSYEVTRSLSACEAVLLLVDASQGIQAQTLSVFQIAKSLNLSILPILNKIDLPHANPDSISQTIEDTLKIPKEQHLMISAKSGMGVEDVLEGIVGLPGPGDRHALDKELKEGDKGKLRALVVDTYYDRFRGVISLVRIFSGSIKRGDKVHALQSGKKYEILDLGVLHPEETPTEVLLAGQVGYISCNMKNAEDAHVGDTICHVGKEVTPLPGSTKVQSMVYSSLFPLDPGDFPKLEESIAKLTLTDRSVSVSRESSLALGQGCRLGFLGSLHLDVFQQRLEDEYASSVIATAPSVPYLVCYKDGRQEYVSNPAEFPDHYDGATKVDRVEEPMVTATMIVKNEHVGTVMEICNDHRGFQLEHSTLDDSDRVILKYTLPLSEIVVDFFGELKGATSGYATFEYEAADYQASDLVKLNLMVNGDPIDALSMIVHRSAAARIGKEWVKKLKNVVPRQQFALAIQAAIGGKVIARETLSAFRKDVTAGLYGGHYERKMKHLEKQKRGKARLKALGSGNVHLPQSAFYEVLSSKSSKSKK